MVYKWTTTEENLLQLILELEGLTFENIYNMFNTIALDLCLSQENREIPYYTRQFPQLSIVKQEARSRDAIKTHYYRLVRMFPNLKKFGSKALFNETDELYQESKRQITEKLKIYILAGENEQTSEEHSLYGGGVDDLSPYGGDHNNTLDFSSSNNQTVNDMNTQTVNDMNTHIRLLYERERNKGREI